MTDEPSLSVVITTYNEEVNVARAVRSARLLSDDVLVLDSGSTDATTRIAAELGARVLTRAFDDMATQRNHALEAGALRGRHVFFMDADEMVTAAFARGLRELLAADPRLDGVSICRKFHFGGRWVPAASSYPCYVARVVRARDVRFRKEGHGEVFVGGQRFARLAEPLHDEDLKGVRSWIARHNDYAAMEAREDFRLLAEGAAGAPLVRRVRAALRRLPGWPLAALLYYIVIRRGLFEGPRGWTYCAMKSMFEYFVQLHTRELRRRAGRAKAES